MADMGETDFVQKHVEEAVKHLQKAAFEITDRDSMDFKRITAALLSCNMILEERLYFDARDE